MASSNGDKQRRPAVDESSSDDDSSQWYDFDKGEDLASEPRTVDNPESAALASRMPGDQLTAGEMDAFPQLEKNETARLHYLDVRNNLLFLWHQDPLNQLTVATAKRSLVAELQSDEEVLTRCHKYLERTGRINMGVFKVAEEKPRVNKKVIILGSGMAGLGAARQLNYLGVDVTVVEARSRVGGRISTWSKELPNKDIYVADLGAMVVTGLGGNPMATLTRQVPVTLAKIDSECRLYDSQGNKVPKSKDDVIEREFNRLLDAAGYLSHEWGFNQIEGRPLALGEMLELVIKLQEHGIKTKLLEYYTQVRNLQSQQLELANQMRDSKAKVESHHAVWQAAKNIEVTATSDFQTRVALRNLRKECAIYKKMAAELWKLETEQADLEATPPTELYLATKDRQILDWHFANLEFANASPLSKISLKHWDQDDDFEFTGSHLVIRDGYGKIPLVMAEDLTVLKEHEVIEVKYETKGCEVLCRKPDGTTVRILGDVVLCTLPLGVLKHALLRETIHFLPALPDWKTSAIKRLGFGNLNKVILCFDQFFWPPSRNLFGHIGSTTASRGELFLFWSLYRKPVLIALMAGEAANFMEGISDYMVKQRCMQVLRNIFNPSIPDPLEVIVTRWGYDQYARGSYSYMSVGCSAGDYDQMAAPVPPHNTVLPPHSAHNCRLFFAGEHTNRQYPATVHGALLSGLREAAKIAEELIGPV